MKKSGNIIYVILIMVLLCPAYVYGRDSDVDKTVRKERKSIKSGNKLYNENKFAEAEVEYKKALTANANSYMSNYNLAISLIKQSGGVNSESESNPLDDATELLNVVAQNSKDKSLRSKSYYNLGNLAYNQQDYEKSIEMYKNALRLTPNDDKARENLRLAQLKKNEQDQNKDNKNNKDNKEKEEDQKQNKNEEKEDKQDKNKENKQQKPHTQEMSKDNMEQILQTMQNQEKATQEKVNAEKPKSVRKTGNQW